MAKMASRPRERDTKRKTALVIRPLSVSASRGIGRVSPIMTRLFEHSARRKPGVPLRKAPRGISLCENKLQALHTKKSLKGQMWFHPPSRPGVRVGGRQRSHGVPGRARRPGPSKYGAGASSVDPPPPVFLFCPPSGFFRSPPPHCFHAPIHTIIPIPERTIGGKCARAGVPPRFPLNQKTKKNKPAAPPGRPTQVKPCVFTIYK